jgi:hypothetical protein
VFQDPVVFQERIKDTRIQMEEVATMMEDVKTASVNTA